MVLEVSQMTLGQCGRHVNSGRQRCSHTKGQGDASKRLASYCVHYGPHSRKQPRRPGRVPPPPPLWLFPSLLHSPGQGAPGVHSATVFLSLLRKGPCDSTSVTSWGPNVESVGTFRTTVWGEAQLPVSLPLPGGQSTPETHP